MVLKSIVKFTPLNPLAFNPLLSVPVMIVVVFAVSLMLATLIRRIPVVGKAIV